MEQQDKLPDSVVSANYFVVYSGTPLAVAAWIEANNQAKLSVLHQVLIGETGEYVDINAYMEGRQAA